ncbi:alanine racemase [Arcanobacterium hippocoleae]
MKEKHIADSHFPSRALISKQAFVHNLRQTKKLAGAAEVMAVVKADAYGHGAYQIGQWALDAGIRWLAVAQLGEAIELRKALGQRGRMLALIADPSAPFAEALELGIDLSLGSAWALAEITAAAEHTGKPARVHIEVDTGMARGGFTLQEFRELVPQIMRCVRQGVLETVGLWSHFACADELSSPATEKQIQIFETAKRIAAEAGMEIEYFHIAASSALLWHPESRYSMVRPGAILYGISPEPENATAEELGFKPVMTLEANLISVRDVPAGTGVSYGHTAVTEKEMRLATVPLGYADGIPRHASNTAQVMLHGRRRNICGRVCMDQFVIAADGADPGDTVTLFGSADAGNPTADEWAKHCDTIGYEIVCRLGVRVPRYYVD